MCVTARLCSVDVSRKILFSEGCYKIWNCWRERLQEELSLPVKGHSHLKGVRKIIHSEEESQGKSQHISGDTVRNKGQSKGQGRVRNNMPSFPVNLLHMEGIQEGMFILNTSEEEGGRWFQIGVKQTLNTTLGASHWLSLPATQELQKTQVQ